MPEIIPAVSNQSGLTDQDIVCVGFADWDTELWTNQHHLMSRLAQSNKILFVESLGLRSPTLASRDLTRMGRRLRRGLGSPRARDGLYVTSPLVIPAHRYGLVRKINRRLLPASVTRAVHSLRMRKPILWAYVPQAEALLKALDPGIVVYHCVDDIAAQAGVDAASFRAAEKRFAARADIVLASSPPLAERMRTYSQSVLYMPNVADTALFSNALQPGPLDPEMELLPHPRILFVGAIVQTKLDMALLVSLARMRPQWSIALVGPVGPGDPSADVSVLRTEPNIHLLGHRPHFDLPAVLRAADAGLIPYAINPLTRSVFPMKVYEYLAAGLPVLSTPLPSLAEVPEVIMATDAADFAQSLEQTLKSDSPAQRAERSRVAEAHSWEQRLREIAAAIHALQQPPSTAP